MDLEHTWFAARAVAAGRRRDSYAAAYVDVLAATPLISATSLAAGLGVTVKSAIRLLDGPGRRRRRRRGHATVEAAAVRAQGDGPAWRGRPTALPARAETRARSATYPGARGRCRRAIAATAAAHPGRAAALRLQRSRALHGADGSGDPPNAPGPQRFGRTRDTGSDCCPAHRWRPRLFGTCRNGGDAVIPVHMRHIDKRLWRPGRSLAISCCQE